MPMSLRGTKSPVESPPNPLSMRVRSKFLGGVLGGDGKWGSVAKLHSVIKSRLAKMTFLRRKHSWDLAFRSSSNSFMSRPMSLHGLRVSSGKFSKPSVHRGTGSNSLEGYLSMGSVAKLQSVINSGLP